MATIMGVQTFMTGNVVGEPWLQTFYFLPGTPGGSNADATDALDHVRDFWGTVGPVISTGVTINWEPTCLLYNDATGALVGAVTGVPGSPATSGAGSTPLPKQTQGLVSWTTAGVVNSRRVIGRTYIPFPDESANSSSSQPDSTYTTTLAAAVSSFLGAGTTATEPVVWHRPINKAGGSSHPILAGTARSQWAVLRTRR